MYLGKVILGQFQGQRKQSEQLVVDFQGVRLESINVLEVFLHVGGVGPAKRRFGFREIVEGREKRLVRGWSDVAACIMLILRIIS